LIVTFIGSQSIFSTDRLPRTTAPTIATRRKREAISNGSRY